MQAHGMRGGGGLGGGGGKGGGVADCGFDVVHSYWTLPDPPAKHSPPYPCLYNAPKALPLFSHCWKEKLLLQAVALQSGLYSPAWDLSVV